MSQQPIEDHWSPLKCSRLSLMGEGTNGKNPTAQLIITVGGNAKFSMYKNTGDGDTTALGFELGDPVHIYDLVHMVRQGITKREETGVINTMQLGTWFGRDRQRLDAPATTHAISVARDEKGRVSLWFQVKTGEPYRFPFRLKDTVKITTGNGERISVVEESEIAASGWCNLIDQLAGAFIATSLKKPPPKQPGGNQYGSGSYKQPYQQQRPQQQQQFNPVGSGFDDFDDDIKI